MKLDDTDRAIVEHLQRDGRAPFTQVAAELGLGEGAVRKRVQRLTESGAMQVVAVRLTVDEVAALDAIAGRDSVSRSEAIRRALAHFAA